MGWNGIILVVYVDKYFLRFNREVVIIVKCAEQDNLDSSASG